MDVITRHSYYMDEAIDLASHPRRMANMIKKRIPESVEYDTIVGSGLSGILVVPGLAKALKKEWGVVRKESELQGGTSHAEQLYEGTMGRRWVLIDDFMCSGATVKRVVQAVHKTFHAPRNSFQRQWDTEFIGLCEYSRNRSTPWRSTDWLLDRGSWNFVDIEGLISTARPLPAAPGVESPPAARLQAVPSGQSPESEDHGSPQRVPCSPVPVL